MKRFAKLMGVAVALSATVAGAASGWEANFDKAAETAKQSGKYLLVDFSGSD